MTPEMKQRLQTQLDNERSKFGAGLSNDECVLMLNRVAWNLRAEGYGLLSKPSGNNGKMPVSGTLVSVDSLFNKVTGLRFDALFDAGNGGPSNPQVGDEEELPVDRWVAPEDAGGQGEPDPNPPPSTQPPSSPGPDYGPQLDSILTRLIAIESRLQRIEDKEGQFADVVSRLEELKAISSSERNVDLGIKVLGTAHGRVKAYQEV